MSISLINSRVKELKQNRWENRRLPKWEKVRRRGETRFLLRNSLLFALTLTAARIIEAWIKQNGLSWDGKAPENIIASTIMSLTVFGTFGLIWALWIWHSNESRYKQWQQRTGKD